MIKTKENITEQLIQKMKPNLLKNKTNNKNSNIICFNRV